MAAANGGDGLAARLRTSAVSLMHRARDAADTALSSAAEKSGLSRSLVLVVAGAGVASAGVALWWWLRQGGDEGDDESEEEEGVEREEGEGGKGKSGARATGENAEVVDTRESGVAAATRLVEGGTCEEAVNANGYRADVVMRAAFVSPETGDTPRSPSILPATSLPPPGDVSAISVADTSAAISPLSSARANQSVTLDTSGGVDRRCHVSPSHCPLIVLCISRIDFDAQSVPEVDGL